MKAALLPSAVFVLLLAPPASATDQPYGWTISASNTDPFVNTVSATFGLSTFYLWLVCCDLPARDDGTPRQPGMAAAEFGLDATGMTTLAFQPACFSTNPPGFPGTVLVSCGGCPCGPVVLGSLLVLNLPGSLCFVPSDQNGVLGTIDCEPDPQLWGMDWIGISSGTAPPPCSAGALCEKPVAVESTSWGRVKAGYR